MTTMSSSRGCSSVFTNEDEELEVNEKITKFINEVDIVGRIKCTPISAGGSQLNTSTQ